MSLLHASAPATAHPWRVGILLLNLLATVHVVWFYLSRVACEMRLGAYEQGLERTPFQYRILLMLPLRWAHQSHWLIAAAAWLSAQPAWFPRGVRAEGLAQAAIDLVSVGAAGLLARKLYQRSSPTGMLTACIYPLTLLMVLVTYAVLTFHIVRFVYDLPAMAFTAAGLYLIYTRRHAGWFAALFLVATLNRETTLLLLVFYVIAQCGRCAAWEWRQAYAAKTLAVVVPLAAAWLSWHVWIAHVYQHNPSTAQARVALNLGAMLIPFSWPQLVCVFACLLPFVVGFRRDIADPVLRRWLWGLPIWFAFMLYYGILVEIRIFGELIPYIACVAALIAEARITTCLQTRAQLPTPSVATPPGPQHLQESRLTLSR